MALPVALPSACAPKPSPAAPPMAPPTAPPRTEPGPPPKSKGKPTPSRIPCFILLFLSCLNLDCLFSSAVVRFSVANSCFAIDAALLSSMPCLRFSAVWMPRASASSRAASRRALLSAFPMPLRPSVMELPPRSLVSLLLATISTRFAISTDLRSFSFSAPTCLLASAKFLSGMRISFSFVLAARRLVDRTFTLLFALVRASSKPSAELAERRAPLSVGVCRR